MKKIILSVVASSLVLLSAGSFAMHHGMHHGMQHKWSCTSNATMETTTSKVSGKKMATEPGSAREALRHAFKNCHDCTKITCEAAK